MKLLVVAPHPDDESLGCGGTLTRFRRERPEEEIHWLIVTEMKTEWGFSAEQIAKRNIEIESVAQRLKPIITHRLVMRPAHLDSYPMADLVSAIGKIVSEIPPDTVFVPWRNDAHTDHKIVFDAVMACSKTFRHPSVRNILAYETPSETEFGIDPSIASFRPNVWVDISADLNSKHELLSCYSSELQAFPFPRSYETVTALARFRGSFAGVEAAEAFMLLKSVL